MTHKYTFKNIFIEIKDALKGEERDYTTGSLKRAVFLLSVPMVLEMLMESVFAVTDIFFVSKLGSDAIATVGITESLITIIYALAVGLSVATAAIVSRRTGEKNHKEAAISAYQSVVTGIMISLIIAIPGILFAKDILKAMNASSAIIGQFSGYTSIMFGSNVVIMLLFINNAVFRSAGNPVIAMRVLWFANIVNILLDPVFIFGLGPIPAMGIKGAAIATTTGRGLAVLYQFYLLAYGKGKINFRQVSLRPRFKLIGQIIRLSSGSVSQYIIATSSWIILMRFVAGYGSEVLAGYTIALRIIVFALLPAMGISHAASTLVGQNLGAGNPDRAVRSAWIAGKLNMWLMGIISVILILMPKSFISIFSAEKLIIDLGAASLRIVSIGFVVYGLGMVLVNSLNGAGDTQTPFRINIICFWIIEIPLAWLLAGKIGWEQQGVFWAIVIAETMMTLMMLYFFRKGQWKFKKV
ncbi:MAG: MATE family efflux transporter [Prolixibacteraceae bacterium]|nr:MATE family efflux transporter [Prolixibacteraceae bacterium]